MEKETLNAKQIANWRNILVNMLGPYALMMSDEKVIEIHYQMQKEINNIEEAGL